MNGNRGRAARWLLAGVMTAAVEAGPMVPLARWSFESDGRDGVGQLPAMAEGPVSYAGGALLLGEGAVLRTPPVPVALGDMTMHAEVRLRSLGVGGLTVMEVRSLDGRQADLLQIHAHETGTAIWRLVTQGSAPVYQTPPMNETNVNTTVHLTAVHTAQGGVSLYRDGLPIGTYQTGQTNGYAAGGSRVSIGPRTGGTFNAGIEEVALFDRALSPAEVVQLVPALEWLAPDAPEASGKARITLNRLGPVEEPFRVRLQTRDGTARAGVDYVAQALSVEFAAGERSREIEIPLINDDLGAGSRSFEVVFSDPEPARRVPSPAVVWIRDDDQPVDLVGGIYGEGVDGEYREGGRVTVWLTRTGSVRSARRFQTRVRLVPTEPDALVQPARPGIDLGQTEHTFELGPGITNLTAVLDLPDDREADGLRGFRLMWESEVGAVRPWSSGGGWIPGLFFVDSWDITIEDNEHDVLGQEVLIAPYLRVGTRVSSQPFCLRNGETLMLVHDGRGQTLRWFGPDGLPRERIAPISPLLEEGIVEGVHELADGRLLLRGYRGDPEETVLHRLTADGRPDPGFASGRPVSVTDPYRWVVLTEGGNGAFWVRGDDALHWVSPDGNSVQTLVGVSSIAVSGDGGCWVLRPEEGVRRYRADGTLVFASGAGTEVSLWELLGVDAQGRCYGSAAEPDGSSSTRVVRFRPDGSLDSGYAVSLGPRPDAVVRVLPNGSLLASTYRQADDSYELVEAGSDGTEILRARYSRAWRGISGFSEITPIPGASQELFRTFIPEGGWGLPTAVEASGFLLPDGTMKGFAPGRTSWAGGATWTRYRGRVTRRLPWREAPRVGFVRTGVFVSGDTAHLPVRRTGSTAQRVQVRGEWRERIRGEWRSGEGQIFEVEFPEGVADTVAAVRLPEAVGRSGTREFLMRLTEAGAEDGADLGVCRVWVLAPGIPLTDGLQMHPVSGPDLAMDAVLTGVTTERGLLESAESLRGPWGTVSDAEWGGSDENLEITVLGGATNRWAMPVHAGPEPVRFYRYR